MKARLRAGGFSLQDDIDTADILVINTCSFIEEATSESISIILEAAGVWLPEKDDRKLLVSGCMVSRYGAESLKAELPEVSSFIPVVDEENIVEIVEELTGQKALESKVQRQAETSYAYVKISDGCHKSCAYCTIPSIRGDYVSRPLAEIVEEIEALLESGAEEIILIGQDTSSYGRDFSADYGGPKNLVELMRELLKLEVYRYRLMYLQPESISDELIELVANNDKIANYFEIPLQHSSKDLLRSMQRAGDGAKYLELIGRIRSSIPDVALRSTFIVGYPGESEENFEELLSFVEKAELDYCGVFRYSAEEGTFPASLSNQIDEDTKMERFQTLRDLSDEISWTKAAARIGDIHEIIIEGRDEENAIYGRAYFQAPDIDGIVRIDLSDDDELEVGSILKVRIEDSILYDLDASVVNFEE